MGFFLVPLLEASSGSTCHNTARALRREREQRSCRRGGGKEWKGVSREDEEEEAVCRVRTGSRGKTGCKNKGREGCSGHFAASRLGVGLLTLHCCTLHVYKWRIFPDKCRGLPYFHGQSVEIHSNQAASNINHLSTKKM